MQVKFYCDLYVSDSWQEKQSALIRRMKRNRLRPWEYVIAISQGPQNQLDLISGLLLRQHVFDHAEIFTVGFADGYDGALELVRKMAEDTFRETGEADIRRFLSDRQAEYERTGR